MPPSVESRPIRPDARSVGEADASGYGSPILPGQRSWHREQAEAKEGVEARKLELAGKVVAFCRASIDGDTGRAARLLDETPEIAGYGFAPAVVLGDAERVREEVLRDPALATRPDPHTGWTPLHAACASRWHHLEPERAGGLLAVVRLLLDAGADPVARVRGDWSPLRCVIASANSGSSNRTVAGLLLERGAVPDEHDLYLACFAHDRRRLLPLLLTRVPDARDVAGPALAEAIRAEDAETVRLLLEAGADPNRPDADGSTPFRLAATRGSVEVCDLLRRHGAADRLSAGDRLVSACSRGDRAEAQRQLDADPDLLARLGDEERAALVRAAERGRDDAVALMLDLGFPPDARGDDGATALHAASYAGSASTVRLLLERGADVEGRDTTWNSTPLEWAKVGSGERPARAPAADWPATVRTLLEHGARVGEIALAPDDPKPPSPEVAALLRAASELL